MPASEQYWRNLSQTHKVFAVSALALLGATLLMMYKDESRSWKNYQIQAEKLRLERIDLERQKFDDAEYRKTVKSLEERVEELQDQWTERSEEVLNLEEQLTSVQGQVEILKIESKIKNAERDKARADYDIKVRDQAPADVLAKFLNEYEQAEQTAKEAARLAADVVAQYESLKAQLENERSKLTAAKEELASATSAENTLKEQRDFLAPEDPLVAVKRWIKQLPIVNGFDPLLKIQYDWPRGLEQELGMVTVDRVDRCRTCHVNIDDFSVVREGNEIVGMSQSYPTGEYEEPFCSHPNPDVYLTASSPHPVNKFGCTVCHGGDGSGTSFQNAEHTPKDPAVAAAWKEEHDWHSNHFWEAPQHPKQFIESSCLKCHHNVIELGVNEKHGATAPQVFKGWETIRDYGCFGCHEINGYDGAVPIGPDLRLEPNTPEELAAIEEDPNAVPGKMRKVGPSLRHIAQKSTPEFVAYWTEEPKRFRPTTRMPQFFDLTNQHDAMAQLLQPMEIAGIAKYLEVKSEELEYLKPKDDYVPNVTRGQDLFSKRGCLACHNKAGEEYEGIAATFGPDLSRIHEKIKPGQDGFLWMYTWIKEPTRYHKRTRMPDLYLTPYEEEGQYIDPAADIAAYLLEGGSTEFPPLPAAKPNFGIVVSSNSDHHLASSEGETAHTGLLIEEVIQGSPASRSERKLGDTWIAQPLVAGDMIVSINNKPIKSAEQLAEFEQASAIGDSIEMKVLSGGQENSYRLVVSTPLDDLVRLYLSKTLDYEGLEDAFKDRRFPVTAEMFAEDVALQDFIKGDEIELAPLSLDEEVSQEAWEERKLAYIGRRTISRYGCYGCHDIPGFEKARPIGAALQDWGRKDTSKLAYEHIHEYLHHHGDLPSETDGSGQAEHGHDHGHAALGTSTAARLEKVVKDAKAGDKSVTEQDLTEAMLYNSVISHGRAGFLWQKLRQPRSYDYKKTETKNWDERLRMPKFPFDFEQIEAVSTFVLGLVAQPPAPDYIFQPDKTKDAIFNGEKLLAKYNCTSCHVLEMDSVVFEYDPEVLAIKGQEIPPEDQPAFDLLQHIKPIGHGKQGATAEVTEDGLKVYRATGFVQGIPDPDEEDPEFRFYSYRFWDGFKLDDGKYIIPSEAVQIGESQIRQFVDGRGGMFGEWLVGKLAPELSKTPGGTDFNAAWQASVPPLTAEGHKVQTPWLYQFLKNPEPLRRTTVLRMPRFNLDDEEAQTLANYFAAKDQVPFPYQSVPQKQLEYQAKQAEQYHQEFPMAEHDYLTSSWYVLNGPLCRKCHNVGGNVVDDPKQVKGPNLQRIENRLRPEWTQLWIYKPMWVYPYTSMPQNFPPGKPADMKNLFNGDNPRQAEAVIDALFNYTQLIETHGETTYNPESVTPPAEGESAE